MGSLSALVFLLAAPSARFDSTDNSWTLSNDRISARFELTTEGSFRFSHLENLLTGYRWQAAPGEHSAPFHIALEDRIIDSSGPFRLVSHAASEGDRGCVRQTIVLDHQAVPARLRLEFELYPGQPVLRYRGWLQNRGARPLWITEARMVNWTFAAPAASYRALRVNQWVKGGKDGNFEPLDYALDPDGSPKETYSGAHGQHCAWLVVRDNSLRGLLFGWEFDGRARIRVRHRREAGALDVSGGPEGLFHRLDPSQEFLIPGAFVGLFRGAWDEASYTTHRFVEAALARSVLDVQRFPYVIWDSWGYDQNLDERTLRRAARNAARMGMEVFVLDLGWARAIGDWREDPAKFPAGIRALSNYVHSLGMKFGLHFAFTEASPSAPMLRQHPDWFATDDTNYYRARSLCLSHRPVRDWIIAEAVRMIGDYGVDWILQDGENMVKRCTRSGHTHDPDDSNYSNAVLGLNAVVDAVQRAAPNVLWENCQDGGNMMTFNMVQRYVTSIAADDAGPLTTRQATYGVSYPFPLRYADRYMPGDQLDTYTTRSYMFGGPWIFMNRIAEWTDRQMDFAAREIALYKSIRHTLRNGRVYRLSARPAEQRSDSMQSLDPATGISIVFAWREQTQASELLVRPRGLRMDRFYRVRFEDSPEQYTAAGSAIARDGVRFVFGDMRDAEILYIEPLP